MVGLDNEAAVTAATRHLVERGFERLWFVVQPFAHISSRRLREAAFQRAWQQYPGVQGQTVVLELGDADEVSGALASLDAAIDAAGGARVALFAANGPVALTLARHLNQRFGVGWQQRVALMSIDDPEWAELAGITTIRQPTYDIGYRAVEFLHERIDGAQTGARDCLLRGELVERGSTAA
jgi:LacI family transcriptional regulator, kdg operon repressor